MDEPTQSRKQLPILGDPPEVVPARIVNEVLYCERLAYLEWAQGEFAENHFTVEGSLVAHRRVDAKAEAPEPPETESAWRARSVWLTSERLGLTAKVDVVDADDSGAVAPIEYKRGKRPTHEGASAGAWLPERAQLCAQVLLLRDHGYRCDEAWIWYAGSREKVAITIDEPLVAVTMAAIARARELTRTACIPPPLVDDSKCRGCSLSGICLPDEVHLLQEKVERSVRRLHPSRDDRVPLYVQEGGTKVGISKERLVIESRDGTKSHARIPNTSHVAVFGAVQISTQALTALLSRNIPVAFFSAGGWYYGRTLTNDSNNVELRVAQHAAVRDEPTRIRLSKALIENKILNQRTLLRRNHSDAPEVVLNELKSLAREAAECSNRKSLLGIEGTAARLYFSEIVGMLKGPGLGNFDYRGRNRRPPKDPLNAMLSFCYALLTKDWALALQLVGLDPLIGFLHEPRFGRPALALDLMEPFRPLVADSVVVSAINNGEIGPRDFIVTPVGCAMTSFGRKRLLAAYERRMSQEITHPIFEYRISYRRVLEVQARVLGRHLLGEIDEYPAFRTR